MHRHAGLFLSIATCLFVVAMHGMGSPQVAWGQTAADVLGAQSVRGEMEGRRGGPARDAADPEQQEEFDEAVADAPAAARTIDYADEAQTLPLNIPLILKLSSLVVVLWLWVAAGEWVNRASQIHRLGAFKWNSIIFFPFVSIAVLSFFMPLSLVVRAPIVFAVFLATWVPFVVVHNKNVEPHQTVLTGPWWRYVFASILSSVGVKVSSERKAEYEKGAPVELIAMGAEDLSTNNANLITARHSPGYLLLKDVVAEMVNRRADQVMFDFTKQAVNVRWEIDGVWHGGEPRDRESSDVMLAVIKTLSNLNVKDRRNKQEGQFGAKYEGKSFLCTVVTQGVQTGERAVITRHGEQQRFSSYEALGMREGIMNQWSEIMASDSGVVIFSALPGGGLTSMMNASLEETDRLMRDFVAIEEVNKREAEVQNVNVNTYDASKGETPATILPKLIRTYPNVYVVRDLTDVETAKILFNEVKDERLVITSIRAKEAAEALLRFLQLKFPANEFAPVVKAVLYQRLIRKLCPNCKVGYTPSPDALRKLGIPPGKVETLYRTPKPEEIEKPCKSCQGLGYLGRTGLFELLVVNDQMREILVKQPKVELLRKAARASRQRSLQEEGILLVAQGTTSLPELSRVLKQ